MILLYQQYDVRDHPGGKDAFAMAAFVMCASENSGHLAHNINYVAYSPKQRPRSAGKFVIWAHKVTPSAEVISRRALRVSLCCHFP